MQYQFYAPMVVAQTDGAALSNTTTATSLLPGQAKWTYPAGFFAAPGYHLKVYASGKISTAASSPGTLTFDFRIGSVIVFNGGASATLATSASNVTWELEMDMTVRSIGNGTSATILGTGKFSSVALSATTPSMLIPASSPAAGTGFDSTTAAVCDLFGTWSVASASNTITLNQFLLTSVW